jgi:hypothetical protein
MQVLKDWLLNTRFHSLSTIFKQLFVNKLVPKIFSLIKTLQDEKYIDIVMCNHKNIFISEFELEFI